MEWSNRLRYSWSCIQSSARISFYQKPWSATDDVAVATDDFYISS